MAANGPTWPPAELDVIRSDQAEHLALYRGQVPEGSEPVSVTVRERSIGYGAVKSKETTTTPSNGSSPDGRLFVPLPAIISRAKSRLLFGEDLTIAAAEATRIRLAAILDAARWGQRLKEAAEVCSAAGDVYLAMGWDVDDRLFPIPRVIHPTRVDPRFKYGRLASAKIITEALDADTAGVVWRHLEIHSPGRIDHELWRGDAGNQGHIQPLTEHPLTADLAATVDEFGGYATGTQRLTVVHVPNATPNPAYAGHPVGEHLGRSDYYGLTNHFLAFNDVTRSLLRDVRHGRSRITVDGERLETHGPGTAGQVNLDKEVYVGLASTGNADATPLFEVTQFDIRVVEHDGVAKHLLDQILQHVGLGHAAIGLSDGQGSQTATEVNARDAVTRQTREDATRIWTGALIDFYSALLDVDATLFSGPGLGNEPLVVSFPPDSVPTEEERVRIVTMLVAAEAISIEERVRRIHPDWDDTKVAAEVERIRTDSGRSASDLGAFPE